MLQTSVEMVKPGGTGTPARLISARPAPLPPRMSFILPSPSARPLPKEYTCLVMGFSFLGGGVHMSVNAARRSACATSCCYDLREVGDRGKLLQKTLQ